MWTYLSDLHEITLALSWRQLVATELKKYNYSFFKIINNFVKFGIFLTQPGYQVHVTNLGSHDH